MKLKFGIPPPAATARTNYHAANHAAEYPRKTQKGRKLEQPEHPTPLLLHRDLHLRDFSEC